MLLPPDVDAGANVVASVVLVVVVVGTTHGPGLGLSAVFQGLILPSLSLSLSLF